MRSSTRASCLVAGAGLTGLALIAGVYVSRRSCAVRRLLREAGIEDPRAATVVLAVDIGSSSIRCRAFLLGPSGKIVHITGSMAQVKVDVLAKDGTADAEAILRFTDNVLDKCLRFVRSVGLADRVIAMGFAAFVMNLIGVDQAGKVVTRVLTYADRHEGTVQHVEKLRLEAHKSGMLQALYESTGTPLHTAYAAPQLCRLNEEQPAVFDKVVCWQSIVSLLLARWTARHHFPISYSEASWTGLLDFRTLDWCPKALSLLPFLRKDTLPELRDYDFRVEAGLCPAYAARWPELRRCRFFLGVGDGACANIGSGCSDPSYLAVTVGTSAAARIVLRNNDLQSLKVPAGLWCYRVDKERVLLGGALTDGGSLMHWVKEMLAVDSRTVEAKAAIQQPTAHGLMVLPFLSGERAPGWNPHAQAVIVGMTRSTKGAEIYRACMESVSLRLGSIVRLMSGFLTSDVIVRASGTAMESSRLWRQMLADVLNRPVVLAPISEATSCGVVRLMAEAIQSSDGCETSENGTASLPACRHDPDIAAHRMYEAAMQRQLKLYNLLYNGVLDEC